MAMIFYVEDDTNIRDLVVYALKRSGFEAMGFSDARSFFIQCEKKSPDLVLLDIMLPEESGMSILKKIRAGETVLDRNIPVIMITARNSEYDKVLGLDSGADDYISKPFGMEEFVSRVKALLRRAGNENKEENTEYHFGDMYLNTKTHTLKIRGENVSLTLKEFSLLTFLVENPGIVFDRTHLLERVWGYEYAGESRTVDMHIKTLRHKLSEKNPDLGSRIETVHGIGYRFNPEKL